MIRERTSAGLAAARAEGRVGGRRKKLDAAERREIAREVAHVGGEPVETVDQVDRLGHAEQPQGGDQRRPVVGAVGVDICPGGTKYLHNLVPTREPPDGLALRGADPPRAPGRIRALAERDRAAIMVRLGLVDPQNVDARSGIDDVGI